LGSDPGQPIGVGRVVITQQLKDDATRRCSRLTTRFTYFGSVAGGNGQLLREVLRRHVSGRVVNRHGQVVFKFKPGSLEMFEVYRRRYYSISGAVHELDASP